MWSYNLLRNRVLPGKNGTGFFTLALLWFVFRLRVSLEPEIVEKCTTLNGKLAKAFELDTR